MKAHNKISVEFTGWNTGYIKISPATGSVNDLIKQLEDIEDGEAVHLVFTKNEKRRKQKEREKAEKMMQILNRSSL